jgi:hypothetical protein
MSEPESFISDGADLAQERVALVRRLEELPVQEQSRILFELVREVTGAVLRKMQGGEAEVLVDGRPFRELGLDSLGLIELHARLNAATGLRLPVTVGFDHPTAELLAACLRAELLGLAEDAPEAQPGRDVADEPIAIVGIGCRYPGDVGSPEDLWQLVTDGRAVLDEFPADRGWNLDSLFDTGPADGPRRAGTSYVTTGGFLRTATEFDADFFGIGQREALAMDPQQRLVLEIAWEALERTGANPADLRGSRTGVFVSAGTSEYGTRPSEAPEELDGYVGTGMAHSVISGRIAYSLGLEGPAVTIDTACSGALVALHLACSALRRGECSMALAGGVTVLGGPGIFTEFSRQRGLAPDGRIKAFSADADGTNVAEGAALDTGCSPWSAARRSTRTAPATA